MTAWAIKQSQAMLAAGVCRGRFESRLNAQTHRAWRAWKRVCQ